MKKFYIFLLMASMTAFSACASNQEEIAVSENQLEEVSDNAVEEESVSEDQLEQVIEEEEIESVSENQLEEGSLEAPANVAQYLVQYYEEQYKPEGRYIILADEVLELGGNIEYVLRYQMSSGEEAAIKAGGEMPAQNIYQTTIVLNTSTMTTSDDQGMKVEVDASLPTTMESDVIAKGVLTDSSVSDNEADSNQQLTTTEED